MFPATSFKNFKVLTNATIRFHPEAPFARLTFQFAPVGNFVIVARFNDIRNLQFRIYLKSIKISIHSKFIAHNTPTNILNLTTHLHFCNFCIAFKSKVALAHITHCLTHAVYFHNLPTFPAAHNKLVICCFSLQSFFANPRLQ